MRYWLLARIMPFPSMGTRQDFCTIRKLKKTLRLKAQSEVVSTFGVLKKPGQIPASEQKCGAIFAAVAWN